MAKDKRKKKSKKAKEIEVLEKASITDSNVTGC